jgi:hypothetical protein
VALAIVAGAIANKPLSGGEAWVRLGWILGLRRLGFDVYFAEQIVSASCRDAAGEPAGFRHSLNRSYFEQVVTEFGLAGRAGLLCDGGEDDVGLGLAELEAVAAEAELLVNLSGHLSAASLLRAPRTSLYVDLDPGFTQSWHADSGVDFELTGHDHYATVGLNVGSDRSPIPSGGIEWLPILPPVVLEHWPAAASAPSPLRLTTVASWRAPFGAPLLGGRQTSLKHHQFRRFLELPERVGAELELALDIHPGDAADLGALRLHGWRIVDPRRVASSPASFRDYLAGSGGEFSVAQGIYAEASSGWFSDRSAAYLASGRPALVQDTGVGEHLPVGDGLLTFATLEQAVDGVQRIAAKPGEHAAAARELAVRYLDSDLVLGDLLARIGIGG